MQLLIMGPPGAGKGTQAVKLAKELNVPQISTGDMFRAAAKQEDELGKQIRNCMKSGALVANELTIEVVRRRLSGIDCKNGFVLDGFPRNIEQANALKKILKEINKELTRVFSVCVPINVLIERAVGRRVCKNCGATYHVKFNPPKKDKICDKCNEELFQRNDDNEMTVKTRLEIYNSMTRPLIDYYKSEKIYTEINGEQAIDKVTEDIFNSLASISN